MEVEDAVEKPVDKKKWVILFSILGVMILGLIIAIVVILIVRNNNPVASDEPNEPVEYVPKEQTEGEQIHEQVMASISSKLDDVYADDTEEIFAIYDEYMELVQNAEAKALLTLDYYQLIMLYDTNKEKKQEVLTTLIRTDSFLKGLDSAASVINAASYYEDDALVEEYNNIMIERGKAEGINIGTGSDG